MAGVALVTGGNGFVGRHLAALLRDRGDHVRVLDPSPAAVEGIEWHEGSILVADDLTRAFKGVDRVFHLAAEARLGVPDIGRYRRINVDGTAAVLAEASRQRVRRVVVTSTAAILRGWADANSAPITSQDPPPSLAAMAGPYTRAKLEAQALALEAAADLSVHVVYPTVPVGPDDPTPTPPTAMLRMLATRPPPAVLAATLNLVDVRDVALAHLRAAELDAPTGRHLIAGEDVTFDRLLEIVAKISGRPMPTRRVPWPIALAAAAVEERVSRLRGRVPTASVEGVRLVRHARRHDAVPDLERLSIDVRPIEPAIAATL